MASENYKASIYNDFVAENPRKKIALMVRAAREASGEKTQQFAKKLGITSVWIYRLENPEEVDSLPSDELILALGKHYKVDADLMFRLRGEIRIAKMHPRERPLVVAERVAPYEAERGRTRKDGWLPIVGEAQCGSWMAAIASNKSPSGATHQYIGRDHAKKKDAFLLEARGDSMTGPTPRGESIQEGDLLLVEPHTRINDGDVVVALIGGGDGEATVKIFFDAGDRIVLRPTNPKHHELRKTKEELEELSAVIYRITAVQKLRPL